jgi:hypothetical protein
MSYKLAFINNKNEITMVLHTDETLVESFTNSKIIKDVSLIENITTEWAFDGTNFVAPPAPTEPPAVPAIPEPDVIPPVLD